MRTSTSSVAAAEAKEARRWYRERSPRAAKDFDRQLRRVRVRIGRFPNSGTPLADGFRVSWFDQFPFGVIYRVDGGVVSIVAIAHAKREPGYWLRR